MKNIELLALDVDGTLTNGEICYDENHMEYKTFNAKDGLGCHYLFQNIHAKVPVLEKLCSEIGITLEEVAYAYDDITQPKTLHYRVAR